MKKIIYITCLVWVFLPSLSHAQETLSDKVITWHCINFKDKAQTNPDLHEMSIITDGENIILDQGDYKVNFEIIGRDWQWEDKGRIIYQAKIMDSTGTVKFKSKNDQVEVKFDLSGGSGKFQYTMMVDNFIYQ